ncbi:uncharacterized protein LOC113495927 [Trichoplusia ni]|uniref:Uncharacterized protein LOC113495927 n=1 Tax=Trichoplusia ni TaxID=7111 RepID=A0A7E5VQV3_TRINI|nr:uncharacterized protein LOC113495927 [Trichoplusia ni]
MAPPVSSCAGCQNNIDNGQGLKCCKCSKFYDITCANVSEKNYSSMSGVQKCKWMCQECKSKLPKVGNINTPVRNQDFANVSKGESHDSGLENFTIRKNKNDCNIKSNSSPQRTSSSHSIRVDDSLVAAVTEQVHKVILEELPGLITNIMKAELSSIKEDLQDFRKSIGFISADYDEMKTIVDKLVNDNSMLSKENEMLKLTMSEMSDRLNNLEQHLREENLELQGVPEHQNENLTNLMEQCSRVVGHSFKEDDVVKCTRVAKLNKDSKLPRAIIVKFRGVRKRDEFYSAVYRYNKTNPDNKLNTSLLGISGDKKPVYVSEHLSPTNKILHSAARQKAKEFGYKFVWVKNGRIYARKLVDSRYIIIKNKESLNLIC